MPDGFEPKGSLRDLLSEEEIREVLAPLPPADESGEEMVLVLTKEPSDHHDISAFLLPRGVRAELVVDRFAALDLLRQQTYRTFVIALDTLRGGSSDYLERIRGLDNPPLLGFVAEEGDPVPSWVEEEGALVSRPLVEPNLHALFPWVTGSLGASIPGETEGVFEGAAERGIPNDPFSSRAMEHPPKGDSLRGSAPRPGEQPPDWLSAVYQLLESRHATEPLERALKEWAESEPACAGWGEVTDENGTLTLRAGGPDRNALLAALSQELDRPFPLPVTPVTRGDFGCLHMRDSWLALWWRKPGNDREWQKFASLLPLLAGLKPRGDAEVLSAAPFDRFLRATNGRMHAVRRHGGSITVLLIEAASPVDALSVTEGLTPKLRGEDTIELIGSQVWCLLDRTDPAVPSTLERRLGEWTDRIPLRMVAAQWSAGGASADELTEFLASLIRERPADGTIEWIG